MGRMCQSGTRHGIRWGGQAQEDSMTAIDILIWTAIIVVALDITLAVGAVACAVIKIVRNQQNDKKHQGDDPDC